MNKPIRGYLKRTKAIPNLYSASQSEQNVKIVVRAQSPFLYHLKWVQCIPLVLFTHNVKKIKWIAYKTVNGVNEPLRSGHTFQHRHRQSLHCVNGDGQNGCGTHFVRQTVRHHWYNFKKLDGDGNGDGDGMCKQAFNLFDAMSFSFSVNTPEHHHHSQRTVISTFFVALGQIRAVDSLR